MSRDIPIIPGRREAILTREDFIMLLLLSCGETTEEDGHLYQRGYSLSPINADTLRIRSLIDKGVAQVVGSDHKVLPTSAAGAQLVKSAKAYGLDIERIRAEINGEDTIGMMRRGRPA